MSEYIKSLTAEDDSTYLIKENPAIHYGICSTAAATVAKTVDIDGFKLDTGSWIAIKFTVTNTGAVGSLTLNVNNTGAYSIKYRNGNLDDKGYLAANRIYLFLFDGTYWQIVGDIDAGHPATVKSTDTTSTASPGHGGTFTAVDSVTRDDFGHVTKINTKTVTMPPEVVYSAGSGLTLTDHTFNVGKRWSAKTKGQIWSRLYYSAPTVSTVGSSGILAVGCTRASVVCNATFLITVSHNGATYSNCIELASCNYTQVRSRLVVDTTGKYYFEIYDTAASIASGTVQSWYCCFIPLTDTNITTYTDFTDGTTIPSGYTATNDFTTTGGNSAAAIKNITRSGTTFTATRQDGSTFTFTQQDNNTDTKVSQSSTTTSDFRPIVLGMTHTTNPENLETTAIDQTFVTKHVFVQPSTGNLTLYSETGDSPSLIFRRGTMIDGELEWRIRDTSGRLEFDRDISGSAETWENILKLDPTNNKMYFKNTQVSLSGHTHNYAGSSSAGGAATNFNTTVTNGSESKVQYGIVFVADPNVSEANVARKNNDFRLNLTNGTTSSPGMAELVLGNNKSSTTADNKRGVITLYSKSTSYHVIMPADTTTAVQHDLPATGGTVLNTGTTSFTQTLSSGTKIGTIKINGTSTDLYCQTNTNTDRYVNSAAFTDDSTNTVASPVKMTLTRAGSDTATVTANIPKVSSTSAGVAPKGTTVSSQSQSTKFLREDGSWAAPSYTSIPSNNVTGSGTSGYLTKWSGTNTITNGPQLGSSTTTYLNNAGNWATPPDTKNTAGSTDTSSKIFLIGATSQAANPQTYSDNEVYTTSGVLTTKSVQVGGGSCTMQYNSTTQSLDFVFV